MLCDDTYQLVMCVKKIAIETISASQDPVSGFSDLNDDRPQRESLFVLMSVSYSSTVLHRLFRGIKHNIKAAK